jgi:hypothetical protein
MAYSTDAGYRGHDFSIMTREKISLSNPLRERRHIQKRHVKSVELSFGQ